MDKKLLTQAVAIRDEQQESANTHSRVGGLFVDILQVLAQTLTAENVSWSASADSVNLRFTIPSDDEQTSDSVVDISVPKVSDMAAGVITPAQVNAIKQAASDLVKAEKEERRAAIENLQSIISSTARVADSASRSASEAVSVATMASSTAQTAKSTADSALSQSESASKDATEAKSSATEAQRIASSASLSAENASQVAEGASAIAADAKAIAQNAAEAVVLFGGIRQVNVAYDDNPYTGDVDTSHVLFDTNRHAFFYWKTGTQTGGVYYKQWDGVDKWQKNGEPYSGKLYICGETSYRYDPNTRLLQEVGNTLRLGTSSGEAFPGNRGAALEDRMDNLNLPTIYNVTNEQPLSEGLFYSLASATAATWAKGKAADGLIISFAINEKKWKTYQFTASLKGTEEEQKAIFCSAVNWQDFGSLSAGTETAININNLCGEPDAGAYYTLSTAIAKLLAYQQTSQVTYAKPGLIIAYRIAATEMECKQFCGTQAMIDGTDSEGRTFGTLDLWKDFGGGGRVAAIHLGDTPLEADEKGNVTIPMDNSLSSESQNLVPNAVVSEAVNRLQNNTVFSAESTYFL